MANRVEGGLSTQLNPFGPSFAGAKQATQAPSVGAQVQQALGMRSQILLPV